MITAELAAKLLPTNVAQAGEDVRNRRDLELKKLLQGEELATKKANQEELIKQREADRKSREGIAEENRNARRDAQEQNAEIRKAMINAANESRQDRLNQRLETEQNRRVGEYGNKTADEARVYGRAKQLNDEAGIGTDPSLRTPDQAKSLSSYDNKSQKLARYLHGVPLLGAVGDYIGRAGMTPLQEKAQGYFNDVLKAASGAAVTPPEEQRKLIEYASRPGATAEDIANAYTAANEVMSMVTKQKGLKLSPTAGDYEEVQLRGGIAPNAFDALVPKKGNKTIKKNRVQGLLND